jgi:hypothetical protein
MMLISEDIDNQVIHDLVRDSYGQSLEDQQALEEYQVALSKKRNSISSDSTRDYLKVEQTRTALRQKEFDRREVVGLKEQLKPHGSDSMFSYLSDRSLLKHWVDRFSNMVQELGKELAEYSYSHYVQREGEIVHKSRLFSTKYEDMSANYEALTAHLDAYRCCLPVEVETGIADRLRTLESFLDSMQHTRNIGYGDTPKGRSMKKDGESDQ